MTDDRLQELRRLVRRGQLPTDLVDELRQVARWLARDRSLPPNLAPYGQWDDEAADELFAAWYADRLVGRGRLLALLDRAQTVSSFRHLAGRSLRQHVLNARDRSQAQNLFRRVVRLLEEDSAAFCLVLDARRPQDRWYFLTAQAPRVPAEPWHGADRLLVAHAWALGDFVIIRYRAASAKLAPVLDAGELRRFVVGLFQRTQAALTPQLIMLALSARFDLGKVEFVEHEQVAPLAAGEASPGEEVLLLDVARAVLDGLTPRQQRVLEASGTDTVADIAAALDCSVGTVVNEQRRIAALVDRMTEDADERDRVLNIAADLLYLGPSE